MTHPRRLSFWLVVAAAVLATAWWILYVPYRPERVFQAIPAEASIVCVNSNLAGHWEGLLANPLARQVLEAAGIPGTNLTQVSTNAAIRKWASRLASDQSVIALLPPPQEGARPTLVFATWIGNQSRILRWEAPWIRSRDFQTLSFPTPPRSLYRIHTGLESSGWYLSLALAEGVLMGALSSDPLAVRRLQEIAEDQPGARSLATTGRPGQARALLGADPLPPWGWIEWGGTMTALRVSFPERGIVMDTAGKYQLPPLSVSAAGTGTVIVPARSAADLFALLPTRWLAALLPSEPRQAWAALARDVVAPEAADTNAAFFIALLDQDHCGRLRGPLGATLKAFVKGVKVPTLVMGMQVRDPGETSSRLTHLLEQVNQQYGMTLAMKHWDKAGAAPLEVVSLTGRGFYGMFDDEERIGTTYRDNWLLAGSHAAILKKLMETPPTPSSTPGMELPPGTVAVVQANLQGLAKSIKGASGLVKIMTMFNPGPDTEHLRDTLRKMDTWLALTDLLRHAEATLRVSGDVAQAHLVLSE